MDLSHWFTVGGLSLKEEDQEVDDEPEILLGHTVKALRSISHQKRIYKLQRFLAWFVLLSFPPSDVACVNSKKRGQLLA